MYRNLANKVLLLVFVLFLCAVWLRWQYPDLLSTRLFYMTALAGLVGGIADWFAVTAIFKRPLGFPWHTALIPRHRDRVIIAITEVIEKDLLSVKSIKNRFAQVNFIKLFINWADSDSGRRFLRILLIRHSETVLQSIDVNSLAQHSEVFLKKRAGNIEVAPYVMALLQWTTETGKDKELFDDIVTEMICMLEKADTQNAIYNYLDRLRDEKTKSVLEKFVLWIGEQTDSINISEAAEVVHTEMLLMLNDLKNPEHPLRQWGRKKLIEAAEKLGEGQQARVLEQWKNDILDKVQLQGVLTDFAQTVIRNTSLRSDSPVINWMNRYLAVYWEQFKQNDELQNKIERHIKQAIFLIAENEHHIVGKAVHHVLQNFTNDDLSNFIEDKAGDDLQWIRVNGSIVGGLVGLVLGLFLHFIYDPYFLPLASYWLK